MGYVIGVGHKAQGIRFRVYSFYGLRFWTCDDDFSPDRPKKSCQETIGQYLIGCSMVKLRGFELRVTGCRLQVMNYGGRL